MTVKAEMTRVGCIYANWPPGAENRERVSRLYLAMRELDRDITVLTDALERIGDEARQSADTHGCANCNCHAELAHAALARGRQ
jgi:hypothetical protein